MKYRSRSALFLLPLAFGPWAARAQDPWPNHPVRLIIPFPPGGSTDSQGRLVGRARALGLALLGDKLPDAMKWAYPHLLQPTTITADIYGHLQESDVFGMRSEV